MRQTLLEQAPILLVRKSERWRVLFALITTILVAIGIGAANAWLPPYAVLGAFTGLLLLALVFSDPRWGLFGTILVIALLPFGVIPITIGAAPTFLDAATGALLLSWLVRLLTTPGERPVRSPANLLLLVYLAVIGVAFINSTSYTSPTQQDFRRLLEIINGILVFFSLINVVRSPQLARQTVLLLMVAGTAEAVIALVLLYLPVGQSTQLLASLSRLGYPASAILQYSAGSTTQRAIGTQIDPNNLGGLLMLTSILLTGQWLDPRPLLAKKWLVVLFVPVLACLLLTLSRNSWLALAAGVLCIATIRYRRLWLLLVLLPLGLFLIPDNPFLAHLISGLQFKDEAAALRLGEYKDALTLIQQFPFLGVGFKAPAVNFYVGVSNAYLLMAEEIGLLGLAVYAAIIGLLFFSFIPALRRIKTHPLSGLGVTLVCTLAGALVGGMGDHYFFSFPHTLTLFWLYAGLTYSTIKIASDAQASQEREEPREARWQE